MNRLRRARGFAAGMLCPLFAALALLILPPAALAQQAVAQTQSFSYTVELEVPETLRAILQEHLEIYRSRENPRMNEDQLRLLLERTPDEIREILATEGYYSPAIDSALQQRQDAWIARLTVSPGEQVHVATVIIELHGAVADPERSLRLASMRERWPLRKGMVFRQAKWEEAKRSALQALITEQYPAAKIEFSQAMVDPQTRKASLRVELDSGPAFTFGELEVSGLQRYPHSIVERLNVIEPGTPYSQDKLLQFQARLQDSRYLASALVSTDVDPARPERVPVKVQVVEAQSRKLGFGAGASTDTGARGQVEYQDLNFLDRAWRLSTLLKLESKKQRLSADIQFPRTATGHTDSLAVLTERTDIEGQTTYKYGMGAKRSRVVGNTETAFGLQYQTERVVIANVPDVSSQALVPSYAWTRRKVDNLLYPADGYLLTAQIGVAAKALLSDQDFMRNYVKATYYRRLGKDGGLILRGELGATLADSRAGIPSDYLFRTGGDQSVRGYAYESLGVKNGNAVVGGRYLGVASAEYVHWLVPAWGAAVFYDLGNAADALRDFKAVQGYGAGARWKSPIGLLKMDLAYGEATKKTHLHFSVGISF